MVGLHRCSKARNVNVDGPCVAKGLCQSCMRTDSCLYVNYPSIRAVRHPGRMWAVVHDGCLHNEQAWETLSFHWWRFIGVGNISEPDFIRNDSWPLGSPSTMWFHSLVSSSRMWDMSI